MKGKYFIRGIGAGLILAALILWIGLRCTGGFTDQAAVSGDTASRTEAVSAESTTTEKETAEVQTTEKQTTERQSTEAETETTEAETTGDTTTEAGTTEEETTEAETTEAESTEAETTEQAASGDTEITIVAGMGSEDASRLLYEAGAVKDAYAYDAYLIQNGYASRILVGTFHIPAGASEEEIANIITTTP